MMDRAYAWRACAFAFAAYTCWVLSDTCVKASGAALSVEQQVFFNRSVAIVVYLAAAFWGKGVVTELATRKVWFHVLRGAVNALNLATIFYGVTRLPMANFYVMTFACPFVVAALSAWLLKERPGRGVWAAIVVGFIGVFIAVGPDRYDPQEWPLLPVLAVFVADLCFAFYIITLKRGGQGESDTALTFYPDVFVLFVFFALTVARGHAFDHGLSVVLAMLSGALSGIANRLMVKACRSTMNALVFTFQYSQIVIGGLSGYFFFANVPTWRTFAGAVIVVAAGIYVVSRPHAHPCAPKPVE